MSLGPIEIEVIRNALTAAAAEMDITIWRTSRSTTVRELLDYSTAVFDAEGNNVAQSARIPQHLNSMGAALRILLDRFVDAADWREDDVVATNDPYCGAQHLNDILVFKPVFHDGKRVAYVGALCHHIDMGGMAPGSYAATATEVFQEGLRIPPLKLIEGGVLNKAIYAMIGQNVRKPALMLGDLQSQLASLEVGAASIRRIAARYGAATLIEATGRILDQSEAAMRAAIRAMPDGTYAFEDFLDDDGVSGEPVRLHASIAIKGDEIEVDLTECADQQRGPINCTPAMPIVRFITALSPRLMAPCLPMRAAIAPFAFVTGKAVSRPAARRHPLRIALLFAIGWPMSCSAACIRRCRIGCLQLIMAVHTLPLSRPKRRMVGAKCW